MNKRNDFKVEVKENYDGMKIFSLHMNFLLSNDFKGGANEAILEFLVYRISNEKFKNKGLDTWTPETGVSYKDWLFSKFLEALEQGKRTYGDLSLARYNAKTQKWKTLPLSTPKKKSKKKLLKEKK